MKKVIMKKVIINNHIKEPHVLLYNSRDRLVGVIKNQLALNDVRIQIKRNKLKGYYIVKYGVKYPILENGMFKEEPSLYTILKKQELVLMYNN